MRSIFVFWILVLSAVALSACNESSRAKKINGHNVSCFGGIVLYDVFKIPAYVEDGSGRIYTCTVDEDYTVRADRPVGYSFTINPLKPIKSVEQSQPQQIITQSNTSCNHGGSIKDKFSIEEKEKPSIKKHDSFMLDHAN